MVYLQPSKQQGSPQRSLELAERPACPVVLAGDFNLQRPLWDEFGRYERKDRGPAVAKLSIKPYHEDVKRGSYPCSLRETTRPHINYRLLLDVRGLPGDVLWGRLPRQLRPLPAGAGGWEKRQARPSPACWVELEEAGREESDGRIKTDLQGYGPRAPKLGSLFLLFALTGLLGNSSSAGLRSLDAHKTQCDEGAGAPPNLSSCFGNPFRKPWRTCDPGEHW